jgi:hypothetical protein
LGGRHSQIVSARGKPAPFYSQKSISYRQQQLNSQNLLTIAMGELKRQARGPRQLRF